MGAFTNNYSAYLADKHFYFKFLSTLPTQLHIQRSRHLRHIFESSIVLLKLRSLSLMGCLSRSTKDDVRIFWWYSGCS